MKKINIVLLLLVFLTLGCSQETKLSSGGANNGDGQKDREEEAAAPEDKLAGYDFGGKEIRILTSINESENWLTNSNYMIEGTGAINGEIVNDSVYKRNMDVENLLNIKFNYSHIDEDWQTVQKAVAKLLLSGSDDYDLIINDLRSMFSLSLENMFLNANKTDAFDLSRTYWYADLMDDLTIGKNNSFILAGDYFIDILRNCHALYLNKSMLETQTPGGSDELYKKVLDGKWTFDEFLALTKAFLKDVNGDGAYKDGDDQFGFICVGTWGSAMPFMISADTDLLTKGADGVPALTMNNPKSVQLHEYLTQLFAKGSGASSTFAGGELISQFEKRKGLMVGYQRLATLEQLRGMEDEVSILPYPKLSLEQEKYRTNPNNVAEIGVIPATTPNFETVCVVIEALNRETKNTVLPAYYEQSLKIKYARDDASAQIIDIIHDNMGNVLVVALEEIIPEILPLFNVSNNKNFTSAYEKAEAKIVSKLDKVIEMFMEAGS